MAELLSIKTSADKEDICTASHRCLVIYRHLEQILIAFTCKKDKEKDILVLLNLSPFAIHNLR